MKNHIAQNKSGTAAAGQIGGFLADLERQGKSPHTIRNYRADLLAFQRWFDGTNHEDFEGSLLTPTDVREYRAIFRRPVAWHRRRSIVI